jgi:D-alanyl-D-alanine carboxypeptidase (penicillin-binding protein 5/6)
MNEKAQSLHLDDTHFSDGIGLDDDENYSTVVDLARLSATAMKNHLFAQIVSTAQKTISNINRTHQYTFSTLNKLLGYNGVNGIKTGTTEGAGEVLVTSAVINGHTFIIITMNSQDRFGDTSALLNFISENVKFVDLSH